MSVFLHDDDNYDDAMAIAILGVFSDNSRAKNMSGTSIVLEQCTSPYRSLSVCVVSSCVL